MPTSGSTASPIAVFRVTRPSTVDLIATELRGAIQTGALAVGSAIGEVEIAAQLGVSRSPLREAAQRLVQEGLLTATPGRGLRVAEIPAEHLDDLYDARVAVEAHALRLIVRRGDAADVAAVKNSLDELMRAAEGTDAREIGDADVAFHRTIVTRSGNARLERYFATLAVETRIASFSTSEGYVVRRDLSPTYQQIVAALTAGNAQAAVVALESQMAHAVARLRGESSEHGVEFDTVEEPLTTDPLSLEPLTGR